MLKTVVDSGTATAANYGCPTSPARPARPTRTPTPGSSATRREPLDGGLGRLPGRPHLAGLLRLRRHLLGADLERVHVGRATRLRRLRRAREPARALLLLRRARGLGSGATTRPRPTRPRRRPHDVDNDAAGTTAAIDGGGGNTGGYDPDLLRGPGRGEDVPADGSAGEFALIAKLSRAAARAARRAGAAGAAGIAVGSGDDAAVTVPAGRHRDLGRPGRRGRPLPPLDLAAAGDRPQGAGGGALGPGGDGRRAGEAYVQLGLPPAIDEDEAWRSPTASPRVAAEHGVAVLGGDSPRAPRAGPRGHRGRPRPLGRRARPPRRRRAGRPRLRHRRARRRRRRPAPARAARARRARSSPAVGRALRRRQLAPRPRLAAGAALAGGGARAMIDVCDGLGADAGAPRRGQRRPARDRARAVPVAAGVAEVAAAADRRDRACRRRRRGLRAAGDAAAGAARGRGGRSRRTPGPRSRVGRVAPGAGSALRDAAEMSGTRRLRPPSGVRGFRHLRRTRLNSLSFHRISSARRRRRRVVTRIAIRCLARSLRGSFSRGLSLSLA